MATIKHTKNELKVQRDALRRYERFLPMLQLKKQQLLAEIQSLDVQIAECARRQEQLRSGASAWLPLLNEEPDFSRYLHIAELQFRDGNIAGVTIPVLENLRLATAELDLFLTPPWYDDALQFLGALLRLGIERRTLEEQRRRIAEELRTTSQRVNLFEKVKVPECRDNIRVIRIFLGDQQTAAVACGKIAKSRLPVELESP